MKKRFILAIYLFILLSLCMALPTFAVTKNITLPVGSSLLVEAAFPAGNGEKLFSGYKKQRIPRHKYADREMFSAGFSILRWSSESYPDRGGYIQREGQRYSLPPHQSGNRQEKHEKEHPK